MSDDEIRYDVSTPEGIARRDRETTRRRIPAEFRDAVASDLNVLAWCDQFANGKRPARSLLITGPTGSGKTWQAYGAITRAAAEWGVTGWLAITGPDLYARLRPRDGHDSEGEFSRYASVPLLLLDDFGASKESPWTEETGYRIVNHRGVHLLPTIYTTNLPLRAPAGVPSLRSALSERVYSRLAKCKVVAIKGADRRMAS